MAFQHPTPWDTERIASGRATGASRGIPVDLGGVPVRLEERDRRIIARALEFSMEFGSAAGWPVHRHRQLALLMLDGIDE